MKIKIKNVLVKKSLNFSLWYAVCSNIQENYSCFSRFTHELRTYIGFNVHQF